jgi:hypothetical protein
VLKVRLYRVCHHGTSIMPFAPRSHVHLPALALHTATQDLNGGEVVPPEEAEWVIESADGKGPKQLQDGVLNKEVCARTAVTTPHRATPR